MDELLLDNRIAGLIIKYLQDEITETERQELQAWVASSDRAKEIFEELTSEEKLPAGIAHYGESRKRILEKIHAAEPETKVVVEMNKGIRWKPWVAAAVVIGIMLLGYVYWVPDSKKGVLASDNEVNRYKNDVPPGSDKAILQLQNGAVVQLDSSNIGVVAVQGNVSIKNESGELIYSPNSKASSQIFYNKITTLRGGRYRLTLGDGTRVWLNAESSIYFPTKFSGDRREVTITGEAFFEVAKNMQVPFSVKVKDMTIEVTGTAFNVMAYENEPSIATTLVEGSVSVRNGTDNISLKPGEQAELTRSNILKINKAADIDQITAWKEDKFRFSDADIKAIMRQLERWYDIEVVYEADLTKKFSATNISRDLPISELLKLFELTEQIRFKVDGKRVTVMF